MACFFLYGSNTIITNMTKHGNVWFSNCGTRTINGKPTIVYWNTALIKIRNIKKIKIKKTILNISHIYLLIRTITGNII